MGGRKVDLGNYFYYEKDRLGEGAFGEVFLGHSSTKKDQSYAVKRIWAKEIDKREIQILQELSEVGVQHANLVTLIDYIEDKDSAYVHLIIEYCNGGDLAKYLKEKRKLDERSIKILLQQIASGLKVLHDHNIIHRDLKPANILLNHNGARDISDITFKIADFGIGRFLDAGALAGTICGTPVFMAPELFVPKAKYDYKVDLWSIGVIVYECLTGHLPYDTLPGVPGAFGNFERLQIKYPDDISYNLKDLLRRLLCVKPLDRITFNAFIEHPFIDLKSMVKPSVPEIPKAHVAPVVPAIATPAAQIRPAPEGEYRPHPQNIYTCAIPKKSPATFKLEHIEGKDVVDKPFGPFISRRPFVNSKVFQNVDAHAVEVSKEEHDSLRDLVWHLIFARNITNELEKARAVFLWLCCKDLTRLNFHDVQKNSPEEILIHLQQRKTTYPVVYEKLCGYAGLQCKTIGGYAKGNNFKIGTKLTGDDSKHSWNAVQVDGTWRLVDCTWAARKYVDKNAAVKNITYELNEYHFMPEPEQFIFTHFPDDSKWQLLAAPITLTDFENLVLVTSTFFKYGLEIRSHRKAAVHAKQGEQIHIGCPLTEANPLVFTFSLTSENGKEQFQSIQLDRFGMQETIDNESIFTLRLPAKGIYSLIIYAKHPDPEIGQGKYVNVCEYQVFCDSSPIRPFPYPPVAQTSWGPREVASKYKLIPLQKNVTLKTVNGEVEIRFQVPKELNFAGKLKSNDMDEKALERYYMHRMVGDVSTFTIRVPNKGEFGFEVWVSDPVFDGNSLIQVYQYLIVCDELIRPESVIPLSGLSSGYLGPRKPFKALGLSTVSHTDPYIQTDRSEITIDLKTSQAVSLSSELIFMTKNSTEDKSQFVLQQSKGSNILLLLKFPKEGFYKLQIYARPQYEKSGQLPGVYNYLIKCNNKQFSSMLPYPEQFQPWKDGCYLHEPLEGQLQRSRAVKGHIDFKVDVPKAKSVAVVVEGKDWTQLQQKPSGSWEGEVNMEMHWGHVSKVTVGANYNGVSGGSYDTLLKYSV